MIWLVRTALRRPYTFVVLALVIMIAGTLSAIKAPTDIFPSIRVPVIGVAWSYSGLSPDDMANRIVAPYERALGSTVNNIQHIESQSLPGMGIVKIFFQPGVDIRMATAQVTSISQTILKQMPPGVTPPLIINYDASTVPVLQVAASSASLDEQKLLDQVQNFIRPALTTIPGVAIPTAYGGRVRQIQIDLDPQEMQAKSVSAQDVASAIAQQYQILPTGYAKIGTLDYTLSLNDASKTVEDLNNLPIKFVDGTTIFMHDIGNVRNGSPPQQNIVHVDGVRSVLASILKTGNASTLAVVDNVRAQLPFIEETLPKGLHLSLLNDQSEFVKAAVVGVIREGITAAALTSLMILLFLGSWRSTLIIATSIPLAILASITGLYLTGQSLNIMTLGGLALAVGILVDDGTVTIENINWHLEQGKDVKTAILDGAAQIVTPAFVSLLCICIVFVPMFTLPGVSGYLFTPMAEAVIFAMCASFCLSRTLVPTIAAYLLKPHHHAVGEDFHMAFPSRNPLVIFQRAFEARFEHIIEHYRNLLALALYNRKVFIGGFMLVVIASFLLVPALGEDFFPAVDSGSIELHVRLPIGTRIEDTAAQFGKIENNIRQIIPADQLKSIVDNIGLPISSTNMIYNNSGTIGYQDGDIYISMNPNHGPTAAYVRELRRLLPQDFPGTTFAFLPADIVSQILNFGSPAPIDLQVAGINQAADQAYAYDLLHKMKLIPGIADVRIQQSSDNPQLDINVDRTHIAQFGLTELNVTNSVATALAGTSQTAPTFWIDPKTGVSYPIVAQVPEWKVDTIPDLNNIPVTGSSPHVAPQILGGVASIMRTHSDAVVSHYNIRPVIDIYATTQGRDLGSVAADVQRLMAQTAKQVPLGSRVVLRGQIDTMLTAYSGLIFGLLGAVVMIYLLIVVNFQSWLDPFIIITALPAALAGIVWMLFITNTPLSVPALTGAIMCMGVATANSILVVSFARERLSVGRSPLLSAIEAGKARFRPVLMTALAMIIGMGPMALGLGEGGSQNAPLGRAVIGGLICATCATLFFVPVVFSLLHELFDKHDAPSAQDDTSHLGNAHV